MTRVNELGTSMTKVQQPLQYALRTLLIFVLCASAAKCQQISAAFTITSPADGSLVVLGQNLDVTVTVTQGNAFSAVQLIGENIGITSPLTSPPYTFSLVVPSNTVGKKHLTAVGIVSPGNVVFSQSIIIDCEPATTLTSLRPNLSQISFQHAGQQMGLRTTGNFADGSVLDVSYSSRTSYSSADTKVATVDPTGLVTGVGAGTTTVLVANGGQSATVNISVPASIRGDLNADSKIDLDDVNIILAALNTKATGIFDARDLNGDGVIDSSDLQLLASLCSLSNCVTNTNAASSPAVTLNPSSLSFATQSVGTQSAQQIITLVNTGSSVLNIANVKISGEFAQTNSCGSSLPPLGSCPVGIVFLPSVTGLRTGILTLTDNASGSPHFVPLGGTGTAPAVSLHSSAIPFSGQLVGTTSTGQSVTLTNSGTATLTLNSITITGANSGDFKKGTDTCSASVPPGTNCTIPISFAPTGTGTRNAALTTTDNAPGSPHVFALSGTGTDFSISAQGGGSNTATVTAGQTATYSLQLTPAGFSGTASLSCTGTPTSATCSASPSSITLNGITPATATVTVTTTSRALLLLTLRFRIGRLGNDTVSILWVLLLCTLVTIGLYGFPRNRVPLALVVFLAFFILSCASGGGGGSSPVPQQGTPAGTYTLQVNATSGGATRTISLTLNVQ